MTDDTMQTLIDRLDSVLEDERHALLSGDLDTIGDLLSHKERLIDALNAAAPETHPDLGPLQDKVARNQALLDGALQGIRKVAARMAAFRKIRRTLETYDESGRKMILRTDIDHKVEKRA